MADMAVSDVISPPPGQPDPAVQDCDAGDYNYHTASGATHFVTWMDGREIVDIGRRFDRTRKLSRRRCREMAASMAQLVGSLESPISQPSSAPRLVRAMGLFSLTAIALNGMIGSGIFVLPPCPGGTKHNRRRA